MSKENEYALYQGDTFVDLGTKKQLSAKHGIKVSTLGFYASPAHKERNPDGLAMYIIEDD